jgi:hypothetical protein
LLLAIGFSVVSAEPTYIHPQADIIEKTALRLNLNNPSCLSYAEAEQ